MPKYLGVLKTKEVSQPPRYLGVKNSISNGGKRHFGVKK
jgi:hypothetical protein